MKPASRNDGIIHASYVYLNSGKRSLNLVKFWLMEGVTILSIF